MLDEATLRQHGIRLTPQRRMILAAIAQSQEHLTAEEIHQRILPLYPDMNISTIYRNLERLLDLRIVAVTDLGGGSLRYQAVGDRRHHHLICHHCGRMIDLRDDLLDGLRSSITREYSFQVAIDHLALWGLCSDCQKGDNPPQGE